MSSNDLLPAQDSNVFVWQYISGGSVERGPAAVLGGRRRFQHFQVGRQVVVVGVDRREALEGVVGAVVVVPVDVAAGHVSDGKLEPLTHIQRVGVQHKVELVRETIRAADGIGRLQIGEVVPVVQGVANVHRLVELNVEHADGAVDAHRVTQVGVLQTHLLRAQSVDELGTAARLLEHWKEAFFGRGGWRNADVGFQGGVVQVPVGAARHFGDLVHEGAHVGQV